MSCHVSHPRDAGNAVQYCENCPHCAYNVEDVPRYSEICSIPVQSETTPLCLTGRNAGRPELWRDRPEVSIE